VSEGKARACFFGGGECSSGGLRIRVISENRILEYKGQQNHSHTLDQIER
jgi:hypothetical protein